MTEISTTPALDSGGEPPTGPATGDARLLQHRATGVYARTSRSGLEEQWILAHLPMVKRLVHKMAAHLVPRHELDDLISCGTLGLVNAARAFDPSHDASFKTYAYIRIRGAILDELRTRSFTPSTVLKQIILVRGAYRRLIDVRGNPPGDEDLAAEVGVSLEQLYRTLAEARRQHFLCIHGLSDEEPALDGLSPLDKGPSPDQELQRKETLAALATAITKLSQRERHVLLMYYREELNMKEIAEVLKVTESRVSQIHSSALFKLSMTLQDDAPLRTQR